MGQISSQNSKFLRGIKRANNRMSSAGKSLQIAAFCDDEKIFSLFISVAASHLHNDVYL